MIKNRFSYQANALGLAMVLTMLCTLITSQVLGQTTYWKVTSALDDWSGEYLIVSEDASVAFNGNLTTLDAVNNTISVKISDGIITGSIDIDNATFTITKNSTSYSIKSKSGYYIGQTSNVNGLKSNTTTTYNNTISLDDDGSINFVSGGAYLRYNSNSDQKRFRYYKSSTYTGQKAVTLYKKEIAETKKLTSITLSEPKKEYFVGDTFVKPIVTATYSDGTNTDGTEHVIFSGYDLSILGTQTVTVSYAEGDITQETTYNITIHPADTEDIDCSEYTYELVTDVSSLGIGSKIVITAASGILKALSTNQKENNRAETDVVKYSDNKYITITSDVQILTLEYGTKKGTWALYTGNGYLYAASSSKNYLKTQNSNNDNGSWNITIDTNNYAIIQAQGANSHNYIQYNAGSALFSCYESGTSQLPVAIYKKMACSTEPTVLTTPTNLQVANITATSATLSWTGDENASSYAVFITDGTKEIYKTDITTTSITITELSPETNYIWDVKAIGDGINYADSEPSSQDEEGAEFTTLENIMTYYTITFVVNSQEYVKQENKYSHGDVLEFPEQPSADEYACNGYSFEGWTANEMTKEDTTEPTIISSSTIVTTDITYYAVWKKENEEGEKKDILYASFDDNVGTGGNDGLWSDNIALADIILYEGWSHVKGFGAKQCIKLGSGSDKGSVTTPPLSSLNGKATLTFKAAAWNNDNEQTELILSLNGGGQFE